MEKHVRRQPGLYDKVLSMYARGGVTTRDIAAQFEAGFGGGTPFGNWPERRRELAR